MRILVLTFLLISPLVGFSQLNDSEIKIDSVKFQAKVDLKYATKDGIYLDGYVVNIPYKDLIKLDGKTVEINGVVFIKKGLGNIVEQNDNDEKTKIRQGRNQDIKYIEQPKYRIIKE